MKKTMVKRESSNYVFHYMEGSVAEKEIDIIIESQENCFNEICTALKIKPDFKINYYLVDTPEEIGVLYGDNEPCNGFASEPDKIYAVYNEKIKCIGYHEDAHILSYLINVPDSIFIREGLAMYFDKTWWGRPNEEWTKEFIRDNKYVSISILLQDDEFYKIPCEIAYPIAGAFTKFLIESLGIEKYLESYRIGVFEFRNIDENFKKWLLSDVKAVVPKYNQLSFRQELLADKATMSYNNKWGGTIAFTKEKWTGWYDRWILSDDKMRYYAYIYSDKEKTFVGEIAYHYDEEYKVFLADVIIHDRYRGQGYGSKALKLLCERCSEDGHRDLCDNIARDNPSINMFLKQGFKKTWDNNDFIMLKKELQLQ